MAASTLREGSKLVVRHQADPTLWHERVVLGTSSTGELFLLTPDHEITQEAVRPPGGGVSGVRVVRASGMVPGVNAGDIYRYADGQGADIDDATLSDFVDEARALGALALGGAGGAGHEFL